MTFVDVARDAGLTLTNIHGGPAKDYIVEVNGNGGAFFDYDNDEDLDIVVINGSTLARLDEGSDELMVLYQNDGTGRFHDVTNAADLDRRGWGMGVSVADYDNDGDIDVLIVNLNDRPTLLRNDTRTRHHWVTVRLVGDPTADTSPGGTASTRDAIGARVTIEAAGRTHTREVRSGGSYLSHNDMRVHFGLGDTDTLDRFEIRWPSGVVETINDLEVDRFYIAEESQGLRRITDR